MEYRGKVFSIGGDKGEYTIPNFLSTYTDSTKGPPNGITLPLSRGKQLNNAVSIHTQNIPPRSHIRDRSAVLNLKT